MTSDVREGHIINTWFRCPVCGNDRIEWDVDFEHLKLECQNCGSRTREWIEDITSGGQ